MYRAQTKTILLTGITGNLGAYAALRFLRNGHQVYAVVRGKNGEGMDACRQRVNESLSHFCDEEQEVADYADSLKIIEGDIAEGLSLTGREVPTGIDETWHFASSLKYMPRDREEIFRTNLDGLRCVLSMHRRNQKKDSRFFYISTAYLGGRNLKQVPEARIPYREDLVFNNCYEQSKLLAENLFLDAVERGEVEGAVFRPSIVIGERRAGRLLHYGGLYQVVRTWFALSRLMEQFGERDKQVRLAIGPGQSLNFIPLDDVTDAMLALSDSDLGGERIFNIVATRPVDCRQTFELIGRHTGLRAMPCDLTEFRHPHKTRYEQLASYLLDYIHPYIRNEVGFETRNTEMIRSSLPAPINTELLEFMIKQFVATLSAAAPSPAPVTSSRAASLSARRPAPALTTYRGR
ncbi:MAG TPA: SDR family oxidoreductase [Pyrinomonadaceae bacterium]|nr:SDR family oxidoreductase [Pyrinomonadaceae bacterium]